MPPIGVATIDVLVKIGFISFTEGNKHDEQRTQPALGAMGTTFQLVDPIGRHELPLRDRQSDSRRLAALDSSLIGAPKRPMSAHGSLLLVEDYNGVVVVLQEKRQHGSNHE